MRSLILCVLAGAIFFAAPAAAGKCSNGKSNQTAMWFSIGHPGLGEFYLQDWEWKGLPQKKFWLGFIPGYGWPGWLQFKSARDAKHCRTNDKLH